MLRKTMLGLMTAILVGCSFVSQEALARGGGGGGFHGGGGGFHGGGFHGGGFHGGGFHGGGFHGGGFHGGLRGGGFWGVPYYDGWGPDFFEPDYGDEYPETCGWVRVKYRHHKHTHVRQVYRCW